ncbi:hypothetical protein GCM10008967_07300 [Bacillus carboniphilus]|uniref:Prepilin-type N-terminal cleavage/methylation domain-containing protein n=1 Tax=Bacillus carboniphilus TaxID=86663 RepID=A0ABN0VWW4_9BACI
MKYFNNKGVTLVELLAGVVILGIIAAIAVVSVGGIIENTKEDVCHANRIELERWYERHLFLENIEESTSSMFFLYLQKYGDTICPLDGEISYSNGVIECSTHPLGDDSDSDGDDGGGGVPYL